MGMAEGHKRLLMNAVSKLQSPRQPREQQISIKECKRNTVTYSKKRRLSFEIVPEKSSINDDNDRQFHYENNFDHVEQSSSEDEEQNVTALTLTKKS